MQSARCAGERSGSKDPGRFSFRLVLDVNLKGSFFCAQAAARTAQPREIGDVIVFLASDDARDVTGQGVNVNGGSYMP